MTKLNAPAAGSLLATRVERGSGEAFALSAEECAEEKTEFFFHVSRKPDACDHDFKGWREFDDGLGGEAVCAKCGMGALDYTLKSGF